jgi:hypothetical protein
MHLAEASEPDVQLSGSAAGCLGGVQSEWEEAVSFMVGQRTATPYTTHDIISMPA